VLVALPEAFLVTGGFLGHMNVLTLNIELLLSKKHELGA